MPRAASWPFTRHELEILMLLLSPTYVTPSCERAYVEACAALNVQPDYRVPDVPLAAPLAYGRIRRVVVHLVRWARRREREKLASEGCALAHFEKGPPDDAGRPTAVWVPEHPDYRKRYGEICSEISSALKAIGYVGAVDQIWPLEGKVWRTMWAPIAFPLGPYDIHHTVEIWNPRRWSSTGFMLQVAQAGAEALVAHPELNRCHLRGRTYSRQKSEVLFYTQIAPDEIRFPTLNPIGLSETDLYKRWRAAVVDVRRTSKHRLAWAGNELMAQWLRAGFVVSPAGLAIAGGGSSSDDDGLPDPKPALSAANGVPIVIGVGALPPKTALAAHQVAKLIVLMDHRVFDKYHGQILRKFLIERFAG